MCIKTQCDLSVARMWLAPIWLGLIFALFLQNESCVAGGSSCCLSMSFAGFWFMARYLEKVALRYFFLELLCCFVEALFSA